MTDFILANLLLSVNMINSENGNLIINFLFYQFCFFVYSYLLLQYMLVVINFVCCYVFYLFYYTRSLFFFTYFTRKMHKKKTPDQNKSTFAFYVPKMRFSRTLNSVICDACSGTFVDEDAVGRSSSRKKASSS